MSEDTLEEDSNVLRPPLPFGPMLFDPNGGTTWTDFEAERFRSMVDAVMDVISSNRSFRLIEKKEYSTHVSITMNRESSPLVRLYRGHQKEIAGGYVVWAHPSRPRNSVIPILTENALTKDFFTRPVWEFA